MATPNIFRLQTLPGVTPMVRVDFSTGAGGTIPGLRYEEQGQTLTFTKNDLRIVDCDLGNLVSVTLRKTTDAGSTTFSLFVPDVNLGPTNQTTIETYGVKTLHQFSAIPACGGSLP
jgi:hypothetical protein